MENQKQTDNGADHKEVWPFFLLFCSVLFCFSSFVDAFLDIGLFVRLLLENI